MNRIATFEMFDKTTNDYIGIAQCFQVKEHLVKLEDSLKNVY